jgi:hypothetical protein
MKLHEIKKVPDGTFVGSKLSNESKIKLYELVKKLNVPNPLEKEKYHVTVIYSKKYLPHLTSVGKYDKPIIAKTKNLAMYGEESECLVIELECPELKKRNKEITKIHGATSDYDEYKCHVTLSYDCEDFDIPTTSIKKLLPTIELTSEYVDDLDLNWE